MPSFTGTVRRCAADYRMIEEGDKIAVGVSGGKDSLALLTALAELRSYYPQRFELTAVTLDMGFPGMDFTPVEKLCRELDVPFILRKTQIAPLIFDVRQEKNPCALCAKMRRGALCDTVTDLGVRKLALGHHLDDAIETFLLSLLYEGRLGCFEPVTYMSRSGVTQIRPMVYCREHDVTGFVRKNKLPVVKSTCPMDGVSRREDVKRLIRELSKTYPDLQTKLFGAMQRLPLPGWETIPKGDGS